MNDNDGKYSMDETGIRSRYRLKVTGAVQGVGFRPFVYRLATAHHLTGWVNNTSEGLLIEIEGSPTQLERFMERLQADKPAVSHIDKMEQSQITPQRDDSFKIVFSETGEHKSAVILPDLAVCSDCLHEMLDPNNRRYLYPFINCTNCGPRFSIINALPYDRANTTMNTFIMCEKCAAEYHNPADRRFHAQPNACPDCGPHLELWDNRGRVREKYNEALLKAAEALHRGQVLAVKGLGGFHLMVDATDSDAVRALRQRKHREEKPLAVMFPDLNSIKAGCRVTDEEARLLCSTASPIVLLEKHQNRAEYVIAEAVAPGNPYLGAMLPYTPLHHLLTRLVQRPMVATSGNLSDEPICIDEQDALVRLGQIADMFLVHNRPIARHVDDSVVRLISGREMIIRRARGYAPAPVKLKSACGNILAVGAHMKNAVAVTIEDNIFVSQHIGDLDTEGAVGAFNEVIGQLTGLYEQEPEIIACDSHPDYYSTTYAHNKKARIIPVQHHYAHVLSCMAESHLEEPVLGVAWDGTGYGLDGTIWGGEFLTVNDKSFQRPASIRPFPLVGGDNAAKEPRRSALGLLYELFSGSIEDFADCAVYKAFGRDELDMLVRALAGKVNTVMTSSAGRLFDAVASLINSRQIMSFEGQAAMELEFLAYRGKTSDIYKMNFENRRHDHIILDWAPMIRVILDEIKGGLSKEIIAAKFHNTLAEGIIGAAELIGIKNVVLSGGCFQNRYLTELAIDKLRQKGFDVFWHRHIPPNDGGICLGQAVAAAKKVKE